MAQVSFQLLKVILKSSHWRVFIRLKKRQGVVTDKGDNILRVVVELFPVRQHIIMQCAKNSSTWFPIHLLHTVAMHILKKYFMLLDNEEIKWKCILTWLRDYDTVRVWQSYWSVGMWSSLEFGKKDSLQKGSGCLKTAIFTRVTLPRANLRDQGSSCSSSPNAQWLVHLRRASGLLEPLNKHLPKWYLTMPCKLPPRYLLLL